MDTKRCTKCKEIKYLSEFCKDRQTKSGLSCICKKCHVIASAKWQKNNKDKALERHKRWRTSHPDEYKQRKQEWIKNNPEMARKYNNIRRSKIKSGGIITNNEWIELKNFFNNTCLCCKKKEPEIKLELDHIIPLSLGGKNTIDNAQPLCTHCNRKKWTKSTDYRP